MSKSNKEIEMESNGWSLVKNVPAKNKSDSELLMFFKNDAENWELKNKPLMVIEAYDDKENHLEGHRAIYAKLK